jgi:V8-like Glu-specific endopeptidase
VPTPPLVSSTAELAYESISIQTEADLLQRFGLNRASTVVDRDGKVVSAIDWILSDGEVGAVYAYDDGAIGLHEPIPLDEQWTLKLPLLPSTPIEAAQQLETVGKIESSGLLGFKDEAVFGTDDRVRATPTNYYPRNSMVKMNIGGLLCSGVLVNANTVVTAAHCLYNNVSDQYRAGTWTFEPAQDGTVHNRTACTTLLNYFVLGGYVNSNDPSEDFGAVKLGCSYSGSVGNGFYPMVAWPKTAIQAGRDGLYIVGYPATVRGTGVGGQQFEHQGRLIWDTTYLKTLNVDTSGGQSGGPWVMPCQDYGWYYCFIGPHKGSASFLFGSMNTAHQNNAGDIALIAAM